ncbi:MAG: SUMF1/EgtB/PvdO family nonheme iron enzyme [Anaerolineales bacterium]|nr:SUMF1/EgtB/PvdO family nonheme iron enzyme [Anaerolineales bacterium]
MKRHKILYMIIVLLLMACGVIQPTLPSEPISTLGPEPTPSHTPAPETEEVETVSPEAAIDLALSGVSGNGAWSPFTHTINGVEMALVPAGCFQMGSEDGEIGEKPVHEICFDAPFWIDVYEVTNIGFIEFLNDQGNQSEGGAKWLNVFSRSETRLRLKGNSWMVDDRDEQHPVMEVTWYGAVAYCQWKGGRLPTEAEWEYAARGPDGLRYPWGDVLREYMAVSRQNKCGQTCAVGIFPEGMSWVGGLDMSGNVSEWVNDWYSEDYYAGSPAVNPQGPDSGERRVIRGGSWDTLHVERLTTTHRNWARPEYSSETLGFRCVHSYSGSELDK